MFNVLIRMIALTATIALVGANSSSLAGARESPVYIPPVDAPVIDPFRPPATPYGAGNRGLEYDTEPGHAVVASAPGTVVFAGGVGRTRHVTVLHADGLRTSYSFLRSIAVRAGEVVGQGTPLGSAATRFHFGVRAGSAYLDPAVLLAAGSPVVWLVPVQRWRAPRRRPLHSLSVRARAGAAIPSSPPPSHGRLRAGAVALHPIPEKTGK